MEYIVQVFKECAVFKRLYVTPQKKFDEEKKIFNHWLWPSFKWKNDEAKVLGSLWLLSELQ